MTAESTSRISGTITKMRTRNAVAVGFAVARFVGCACALASAIYSADWMTYVLYVVCLASLLKFFVSMYKSEFLSMGIALVCGGSLVLNMMHPGTWLFGLVVAWSVLTQRELLNLIKESAVVLTLYFNKGQTRNIAAAISGSSSEEASSHEEAELLEAETMKTKHYIFYTLGALVLGAVGIWVSLTVIEHFLYNDQSHMWVINGLAVLGGLGLARKLFKKNWKNLLCSAQGVLIAASLYVSIGELKWVIVLGSAVSIVRTMMVLAKLSSACFAALFYGQSAIAVFIEQKSPHSFFKI